MPAPSASGFPRRPSRLMRVFVAGLLLLSLTLLTIGAVYLRNSRTPDIVISTPTMPADNGYDDFVRAGKLAGQMAHLSPSNMAGTPAQNYTYANYKACAPDAIPVQRAVQAGLKKAYLCPPVRTANALQFPQFALFRATVRAMVGKAGYEVISGQPGQAADTMLDMLEEGVTIPRGGSLIAGLVGIACEAISIHSMEELFPKLNDVELAHVAQRLDTIAAKRVPYADLIDEEGNQSTALLLEMLRKPGKNGQPFNIQELTGTSGSAITWQERLMSLQLMFTSREALVRHQQEYYKALAAEARQPYTGVSKVPANSDPLLSLTAPVFAAARQKFVSMEAVQAIIGVEVALERYKRAQGHYPAALNTLSHAYLRAVPLDPFLNAPLHYRTAKNGRDYVLYSVGADQQDNHATPQKSPGDGSPGDLVARHLWKPFAFLPPTGK